jgi:hypothetical protein
MSKQVAQLEAVRLAVAKLQQIDWNERCRLLELPEPHAGGVRLRVFGMDVEVRQADGHVLKTASGEPVKLGDQIVVLHYLLCETLIRPTGNLVSFRALTGGQFYWQPFCVRTVFPLVKRIGNNVDLLRTHLTQRFDWEPVTIGNVGARIHAMGKIYVTLVYHVGDDEFPPTADMLFDSCISQVFVTEDVAVLASRICLGLLY